MCVLVSIYYFKVYYSNKFPLSFFYFCVYVCNPVSVSACIFIFVISVHEYYRINKTISLTQLIFQFVLLYFLFYNFIIYYLIVMKITHNSRHICVLHCFLSSFPVSTFSSLCTGNTHFGFVSGSLHLLWLITFCSRFFLFSMWTCRLEMLWLCKFKNHSLQYTFFISKLDCCASNCIK